MASDNLLQQGWRSSLIYSHFTAVYIHELVNNENTKNYKRSEQPADIPDNASLTCPWISKIQVGWSCRADSSPN